MVAVLDACHDAVGIGKRECVLAEHALLVGVAVGILLQFGLKSCHCLEPMPVTAECIGCHHTWGEVVIEHLSTGV